MLPLQTLSLVLLLACHPALCLSSHRADPVAVDQSGTLSTEDSPFKHANPPDPYKPELPSASAEPTLHVKNDHAGRSGQQQKGNPWGAGEQGQPPPPSTSGISAPPGNADVGAAPDCTANVPNCLKGHTTSNVFYFHCMHGCRLNCSDKRKDCSKQMESKTIDGVTKQFPANCESECGVHKKGGKTASTLAALGARRRR